MICREEEQKILAEFLKSSRAEFLAIYGRRRIGKTFLIREYFKEKPVVFFNTTGSKEGGLSEQISHFTKAIGTTFYHGASLKEKRNWDETFEVLTNAINTIPKHKKVVLFFDEFPWMVTKKSRLLENLDYYWNQFWSQDRRVKLIICGSSASWIINKIINNKGGLHNRITRKILLEPFNLSATKLFLAGNGIRLNNEHILQIYMTAGGVPYYLNQIKKGLSSAQNIEQMAFRKDGFLIGEFDNLFSSLFNDHEIVIELVHIIASRRYGISQGELFKLMEKNVKGKFGLTKLKELEDTGFIISFKSYQNKQRGVYYKVIDEYVLFYLRWIKPIKDSLVKRSLSAGYWTKQQGSAAWNSWVGLAFESVCYKHLTQISKALELSATALPNTWRHTGGRGVEDTGAQIDLLFDRDDNAITICEIKFTNKPFVIDKQYAKVLTDKKNIFAKKTKTKKQLFLSMITSSGIANNAYSQALVDSVVRLDDLFVNA